MPRAVWLSGTSSTTEPLLRSTTRAPASLNAWTTTSAGFKYLHTWKRSTPLARATCTSAFVSSEPTPCRWHVVDDRLTAASATAGSTSAAHVASATPTPRSALQIERIRRRHEGDVVRPIHVREVRERGGVEVVYGAEEPPIPRLRRQRAKASEKLVGVRRLDRANNHLPACFQRARASARRSAHHPSAEAVLRRTRARGASRARAPHALHRVRDGGSPPATPGEAPTRSPSGRPRRSAPARSRRECAGCDRPRSRRAGSPSRKSHGS